MPHHFRERAASDPVVSPKFCPVCKSQELTTASKAITSSTYWRCLRCGEIWNEERLESGSRYRVAYRSGG